MSSLRDTRHGIAGQPRRSSAVPLHALRGSLRSPALRKHMARLTLATLAIVAIIALGCASPKLLKSDEPATPSASQGLTIKQDEQAGTISVFRAGKAEPI